MKYFYRGLKLIFLGYILNLLRFTFPLSIALTFKMCTKADLLPDTMTTLFMTVDILQFAGIALILITIISKTFSHPVCWLVLSFISALISPMLWGTHVNFNFANTFFELFWGTAEHVDFPVFPWISYPLTGMFFGYLFRITNQKKTFMLMVKTGMFFILLGSTISLFSIEYHFGDYHRSGIGGIIFTTGFILIWLPLWHCIQKLIKKNIIFYYLTFLSKNITAIYFIQWILIGWGMLLFDTNKQCAVTNIFQIIAVTFITSITVLASKHINKKLQTSFSKRTKLLCFKTNIEELKK